MRRTMKRTLCLSTAALALALPPGARAVQLDGYGVAFGLEPDQLATQFSVQQIASSSPANVFFPKEPVEFTWQLANRTDQPIDAKGAVHVYTYSTFSDQLDCFKLGCRRTGELKPTAFRATLPAGGWSDVTVKLPVPDTFGAFVAVLEIEGAGRQFGSAFIRGPKPVPGRVQFPTYAMDIPTYNVCDASLALFQRLGIKGVRIEWGYVAMTERGFENHFKRLDEILNGFADHDITVMITMAAAGHGQQPNGDFRQWLDDDGVQIPTIQQRDMAALPEFDDDYRAFSARIAGTYGWPRGPVNAMELWNEPWEGISISGWGADMLRYRELYTAMAQGIEDARAAWGVDVLIGGTCSTMNTEDKLFCDGTDDFLKWLDFTSIHYQPMAAWGPLVKKWAQRDNVRGPTRVWDTESWIANSEDRVAAAIASMRAQGQSRTAGVLHDASYNVVGIRYQTDEGPVSDRIVQTWAPALAVATTQLHIGQREFREVLFKDGLPWVFVFDGLDGDPDDGCAVVVGDLGGLYNRRRLLYRTVFELGRREELDAIQAQIDALPPDADKQARSALENRWLSTAVMQNGRMTLSNARRFILLDYFGNPVKTGSTLEVPLNGLGYILRTDGSAGSFDALLDAIRSADIRGYEPVQVTLRDMLAPIAENPVLRVSLKNILNRPVHGTVKVSLAGLGLDTPERAVDIAPGESADLEFAIISGEASPANLYTATVSFDAGSDGSVAMTEDMRVNQVAKRSITVDGDLADWEGTLPQAARRDGSGAPSLTEKAWLPFSTFEEGVADGTAVCNLAYDDAAFYVAMRVADSTPYAGNVRFETRDDDSYFYPETYYRLNPDGSKTALHWPEGVRRYTYRRNPDIPSGDRTDNLQIAFNVVPENEKEGYSDYLPGTMPRFMAWPCTDYEFVFNQVAEAFGGGTETWRLYSPGAPRKHFYPRQPKAPNDGGPVKESQLVMKRDGNTRILEASIPWSEMPLVKEAIDAGKTVKFNFRVNDDGGGSFELASNRSVSQVNIYALHDYWSDSWATDMEFSFEK
ncbi:MAG: hypothetical protein ACOX5G_00370 [Kiritimatiellia bacterium]|jgi:hypothetical protein